MSCPYCRHDDTRLAESGFFTDTYYCVRCDKGFERTSTGIKTTVGVGAATFFFGPVGGLIASLLLGADGDSDGGG